MANKATPSTKAAMIIIFIRISPETSGWRAIASIAELLVIILLIVT